MSPVCDEKHYQMHYINVPRLKLLCYWYGHALDLSPYGKISALHELGRELDGLVEEVGKKLGKIDLPARPVKDIPGQTSQIQGKYVSFDMEFMTRNIIRPNSPGEYKTVFTGNSNKDPHIYSMLGEYKLVANIDKRWVATSTAFCYFNPDTGQNDFAGIGFIDGVDEKNKVINMTPFVLGTASNGYRGTLCR
jgi:hypothetical protein